ncbi:hypothetical protein AB0M95_14360 [Sphaerisporangium sp. NPDC051017]|uniref:hypothetical protein n=1 Tax=Sphaerisporangium sp. NPDC051017 TaxID=3154636 RepID=UPI00341E93B1
MPLGCRWCGHPAYAHDASSLPHRRHHQWEQPTPAQMRARLDARRRLGLGGSLPVAAPVRPLRLHPPAVAHLPRHARPLTSAVPFDHVRSPGPDRDRSADSYQHGKHRLQPYQRDEDRVRPYGRGEDRVQPHEFGSAA